MMKREEILSFAEELGKALNKLVSDQETYCKHCTKKHLQKAATGKPKVEE